MKLIDLKAGQGKVDVEVAVKSVNPPRTFNKFGKDMKVASAIISDDSGEMTLSLWNDDADKVKVGDRVKVTNGYVSEFNGQKQLSSGKFGKLEVVNGSESSSEEKSEKKAHKKKPVESEEMEF
ncbi:MAG: OB-fold nucleic acid binding domain-containing protein [Nanoarchaeota archaeon]